MVAREVEENHSVSSAAAARRGFIDAMENAVLSLVDDYSIPFSSTATELFVRRDMTMQKLVSGHTLTPRTGFQSKKVPLCTATGNRKICCQQLK